MNKKTNEKSGIRKEQIMNAAISCFSKYGYYKTTMDDIANTIGMKKASLYYYYKDKEDIFSMMMKLECDRFLKIINKKLSKISSASGKLIFFVRISLEYFKDRVILFNLSIQEILEVEPVINKLFGIFHETMIDLLASIIREGIQTGEFKECDADTIASAIHCVMDSIKLRELQNTKVQSVTEFNHSKMKKDMEYIVNLLIRGIKG